MHLPFLGLESFLQKLVVRQYLTNKHLPYRHLPDFTRNVRVLLLNLHRLASV